MTDLSPQAVAAAITCLWILQCLVCLALVLIDRAYFQQRRHTERLTKRLDTLANLLATSSLPTGGKLMIPTCLVGGSSDGLESFAPIGTCRSTITDIPTGVTDDYVATGELNLTTGHWIFRHDPPATTGLEPPRNTTKTTH